MYNDVIDMEEFREEITSSNICFEGRSQDLLERVLNDNFVIKRTPKSKNSTTKKGLTDGLNSRKTTPLKEYLQDAQDLNPEFKKVFSAITRVNPFFKVKIIKNKATSNCSKNRLWLEEKYIRNNVYEVLYHEIGHGLLKNCVFDFHDKAKLFVETVAKYGPKSSSAEYWFQFSEYSGNFKKLCDEINKEINKKAKEISNQSGISEQSEDYQEIIEILERRTGYDALSDTIDALYGSRANYGHGDDYFRREKYKIEDNEEYLKKTGLIKNHSIFQESFANFTNLKLSNNQAALELFEQIIGQEAYSQLEKIYEEAINAKWNVRLSNNIRKENNKYKEEYNKNIFYHCFNKFTYSGYSLDEIKHIFSEYYLTGFSFELAGNDFFENLIKNKQGLLEGLFNSNICYKALEDYSSMIKKLENQFDEDMNSSSNPEEYLSDLIGMKVFDICQNVYQQDYINRSPFETLKKFRTTFDITDPRSSGMNSMENTDEIIDKDKYFLNNYILKFPKDYQEIVVKNQTEFYEHYLFDATNYVLEGVYNLFDNDLEIMKSFINECFNTEDPENIPSDYKHLKEMVCFIKEEDNPNLYPKMMEEFEKSLKSSLELEETFKQTPHIIPDFSTLFEDSDVSTPIKK